jgi:Xaa-Pro aminopeptidase
MAATVACCLLGVPGTGAAQEGFPLVTTDFSREEFAGRRVSVARSIGAGAIAVIQGAPSPDGYVRFRQSNDVYYLSGLEVPHLYLTIEGESGRTTVYLPHRNAGRDRGEGRMLSAEDGDEVIRLTGVDAVYGTDLLGEHLGRLVNRSRRLLFTPHGPAEGAVMSRDLALRVSADIGSDPWDGRPSREGHFLALLRGRLPRFDLRDLTPILDSLRQIKSEAEIALIRRSTTLAGLGLMEAMRSTEPGVVEGELDAAAKFLFLRNGALEDSYYSLIGSGRNAWYPHYHENRRVMQDGDLVLMDYAPNVGYYNSDVTRMWPVGGRFAPWQRELYGFYLACYRAILDAIKPGIPVGDIKRAAASSMTRTLSGWTFSKPEYRRAADTFVADYRRSADGPTPSLGHWVGMATHDDGYSVESLKPGMVFSIEPALRVPEEQIYIRLEDMLLVTETGVENLSAFVPTEIDAIERLMAEPGLLQRYPRSSAPAAEYGAKPPGSRR